MQDFLAVKPLTFRTGVFVLLMIVLSGVSCSGTPAVSGGAAEGQAVAYKGEVYRSLDGRIVVTIVSSDELEVAKDGVNLICKYTRQPTAIRAVETMMGASQAVYYQIVPEGLRDPRDRVLYLPKALAVAIANKEKEERAREAAIAEERRRAAEAEVAAKAIEARCRTLFEASQVPTKTLETFRGFFESIRITDTDIQREPPRTMEVPNGPLWFGLMREPDPNIREIDSRPYHPSSQRVFEVSIVHHWDQQRWINRPVLASEIQARSGSLTTFKVVFENRAEAERFIEAVKKARSEWREKWSELLNCR